MAVEHWENTDKFDVLRDKTNYAFDEIGKARREEIFPLSDLKDIIVAEKGLAIDNTDPGGLMKIIIEGLSANAGKYARSNGTNISWHLFDIQSTYSYINALRPAGSGSQITSVLTVPDFGHNFTYLYLATIQVERVSTTPSHKISVRLNGSSVKDLDISIPTTGKHSFPIIGVMSGVVPGSTVDVYSTIVGSTDQYTYLNVDLTLFGIPS